MRRVLVIFLGLFASICLGCGQGGAGNGFWAGSEPRIVLNTTDELYRFLTYEEGRFPLISAHRGGPEAGYPENAIETFEYQSRHQPLIIECDIRMTRDSVLILMHDETLDRTSTGKGKVMDYSAAELKELWLKDQESESTNFKIPTLEEALKWGKGRVIFTLDVKRGVPYKKVVEAIQQIQAQSYSVVITYNADQALEVFRLDPDLMISASIGSASDLLRLNDRNIPDNRLVAFVGTREVDEATYDLLHGHGIMCILGTMGNLDNQALRRGPEVYRGLIERGADILSTDRPREAGAVLQQYRLDNKLTSSFIK